MKHTLEIDVDTGCGRADCWLCRTKLLLEAAKAIANLGVNGDAVGGVNGDHAVALNLIFAAAYHAAQTGLPGQRLHEAVGPALRNARRVHEAAARLTVEAAANTHH